MKNFFYLALLTITFLTSCKSSSFLNQRYTDFGHSPKKSETAKPMESQQKVRVEVVAASVEVSDQKVSESQIAFGTDEKAGEESIVGKATQEVSPPSSNFGLNDENTSETENGFSTFKIKHLTSSVRMSAENMVTTFHKKVTEAKRGLVFGIINLALFIVICVVIVAGIIFLVALL